MRSIHTEIEEAASSVFASIGELTVVAPFVDHILFDQTQVLPTLNSTVLRRSASFLSPKYPVGRCSYVQWLREHADTCRLFNTVNTYSRVCGTCPRRGLHDSRTTQIMPWAHLLRRRSGGSLHEFFL